MIHVSARCLLLPTAVTDVVAAAVAVAAGVAAAADVAVALMQNPCT